MAFLPHGSGYMPKSRAKTKQASRGLIRAHSVAIVARKGNRGDAASEKRRGSSEI